MSSPNEMPEPAPLLLEAAALAVIGAESPPCHGLQVCHSL
jgi:hypothetical protein